MENYFDFFGLELSFEIDIDSLKAQYLKNSKEYHPDFYLSDEQKHEQALALTSLNNKAYKTLSKDRSRCKHLLELKGMLDEKASLPPDFLMEMMEWNERIMEAKMGEEDKKKVLADLLKLEAEFIQDLQQAQKRYDTGDKGALEKVKDAFLKMRTMDRLKEQL